ncbi:MAG TPA: hypothetical protein VGQ91_07740 [Ideonella sp.]|jgi:hypothetical protein|nr:hypothetical protein [Ideonella sp.]
MDALSPPVERQGYELRFGSLYETGRVFAFPCDASGQVDLSGLTETARRSYRQVCESVGREFALPQVRVRAATHAA